MHIDLAIVPLEKVLLSRGSRLTNLLARAKETAGKLNIQNQNFKQLVKAKRNYSNMESINQQ